MSSLRAARARRSDPVSYLPRGASATARRSAAAGRTAQRDSPRVAGHVARRRDSLFFGRVQFDESSLSDQSGNYGLSFADAVSERFGIDHLRIFYLEEGLKGKIGAWLVWVLPQVRRSVF